MACGPSQGLGATDSQKMAPSLEWKVLSRFLEGLKESCLSPTPIPSPCRSKNLKLAPWGLGQRPELAGGGGALFSTCLHFTLSMPHTLSSPAVLIICPHLTGGKTGVQARPGQSTTLRAAGQEAAHRLEHSRGQAGTPPAPGLPRALQLGSSPSPVTEVTQVQCRTAGKTKENIKSTPGLLLPRVKHCFLVCSFLLSQRLSFSLPFFFPKMSSPCLDFHESSPTWIDTVLR